MRVLVACEFSGIVRDAFAARGHDAWSCDLLPTERPGQHYTGDVMDILDVQKWDMMIAFPPCTHLAVSGAAWFKEKRRDGRQAEGVDFFMKFVNAKIPRKAIENPVGIMSSIYRKPDQIINPYNFGDPYSKKTCLWLTNLPKLSASHYDAPLFGKHTERGEYITFASGKRMPKWYALLRADGDKAKIRSKTFPGIANAMADQWG